MNSKNKRFIVNGEEVEYFHVQENPDGTTIINFSKEFDVATAHMSVIMKRLRDNNLECLVFKDLQHNLVMIWLNDINDLHGVLHVLDIPVGTYSVDYDSLIVSVDVPLLPAHKIAYGKSVGSVMTNED